jgi:hypothetical protein
VGLTRNNKCNSNADVRNCCPDSCHKREVYKPGTQMKGDNQKCMHTRGFPSQWNCNDGARYCSMDGKAAHFKYYVQAMQECCPTTCGGAEEKAKLYDMKNEGAGITKDD